MRLKIDTWAQDKRVPTINSSILQKSYLPFLTTSPKQSTKKTKRMSAVGGTQRNRKGLMQWSPTLRVVITAAWRCTRQPLNCTNRLSKNAKIVTFDLNKWSSRAASSCSRRTKHPCSKHRQETLKSHNLPTKKERTLLLLPLMKATTWMIVLRAQPW